MEAHHCNCREVDVLVSFAPQAHITLFDMAQMQNELKDIFKREVDLVSKRGLENSAIISGGNRSLIRRG